MAKSTRAMLVGFLGAVISSAGPTHAAIISNGGFELPAQPGVGTFQTLTGAMIPSWTITAGDVDVAYLPVAPFVPYAAFELNQALDLNGIQNGAIRQDFATSPGQTYQLTFAYADNPFEGGISTADVSVSDVGSAASLLATSIAHSTSSGTVADWFIFSQTFVATGPLSRLDLISTSAGANASSGIILDAVAVNEVPEPATWLLAAIALVGALGARRVGRKIAFPPF